MAYRKIRQEDIRRGTVVRFVNMGGLYNAGTIVSVRDGEIYVARPFVYAHEHFDSRNGLIGCEHFSISIQRALEGVSLEVETEKDDSAHKMVT